MEEETIEICVWCSEPVNEVFAGTEGWTVCTGCGAVEGDTKEITLEEYNKQINE